VVVLPHISAVMRVLEVTGMERPPHRDRQATSPNSMA
jgi:hypothetical protein